VIGDVPDQCCFCGQPTSSGIYVRHDPDRLTCEGSTVHRVIDA
jgi:hypothetical protein